MGLLHSNQGPLLSAVLFLCAVSSQRGQGSMAVSTFPSEYQTSSLTKGTSAPSDTTESAAAGLTAGTTYAPSGTQTQSSSAKPQQSTRVDSSPGSHESSAVPSDSRWVTITGAQMMLVVVGVAASTVGVTLGGLVAVCVRWRSRKNHSKSRQDKMRMGPVSSGSHVEPVNPGLYSLITTVPSVAVPSGSSGENARTSDNDESDTYHVYCSTTERPTTERATTAAQADTFYSLQQPH
ncbi:uncharacterized protein LOC124463488 isoform X2 [Hypomesus transpacificus]|uniref:uncharacterized protein LOC124463488 isoform X2 n=1 Tax=Hypomesus transpacificus TaxID=137520 RepID=UPI001F07DFB8|nr:uncharacterized protein LOC124463488 isoform X2 [Hypomesus transpacificus]